MKTEKSKVSIEKGKHEVAYDKVIPESLADAFTLSLKADKGDKLTDAQIKAIADVDKLFPTTTEKDKDGKDVVSPNPILDRLVGHFHYGHDLGVKARVRQGFEKTLEDPTKVVVQGVKGMLGMGFDLTTAYNMTKAQRDAKGVSTPTLEEVQAKLK